MFIPGCGCCGCQPCKNCEPSCITLSFSGFSMGDESGCSECDYLDGVTFVLKRPTGCPTVSLAVSDPTGTGVQLSYTLEKQEDGSCAVTSLALAKECLDVSTGSKSSDEKSGLEGDGTGPSSSSKNAWPCGDGEWTTATYNSQACKNIGDDLTGSNYSQPSLTASVPSGVECKPARATFTVETTEPKGKFKLVGAGAGSGATVSAGGYDELTWTDDNPAWAIDSIGAPSGGSGYSENAVVTLAPERVPTAAVASAVLEAATARITAVSRKSPPMAVSVKNAAGYSYTGTVQTQSFTDDDGKTWFRVSGITPGLTWFPICGFSTTAVSFPTTATITDGSFTGLVPITYAEMPEASVSLDESGCAIGFEVTNQGKFYATSGRPTEVTLLTGGAYRTPGAITGVTLTDGGQYWPGNSCAYTSCAVCATCPAGTGYYKRELLASFSAGQESNSVSVVRRDWYDYGGGPRSIQTPVVTATQSNTDDDGNKIDCDGFTFKAASVAYGCAENGTIKVASVDCEESSQSYCDGEMPDQIMLSVFGMGKFFGWSAQGGGSPGMCGCPGSDPQSVSPYQPFCGCDTYDISKRFTGNAIGPSGYSGVLCQQDCEVVLDLVGDGCGSWEYQGFMPTSPSESCNMGGSGRVIADCGGDLAVPVSVTITPTGLETGVWIAPPTRANKGGEQAAAEVTAIGAGGVIDTVAVTFGGSMYAVEIFERGEPDIDVSVHTTTGSGAVLSATKSKKTDDEGNDYWEVESVTVEDSGTGYADSDYILFTPEEGTTVEEPAWARLIIGREEPTIEATADGGTGAELEVSVQQSSGGWDGRPVWSISSVSVISGGSGYTDGTDVTFTVTDGTEAPFSYYGPASAKIHTTRSAPTITAAVQSFGGSGASLSVSLSSGGGEWSVSGVSITSSGSGYSQWDEVVFSTDDTVSWSAWAYVASVDENGGITGISVYGGGSYFHDEGTIASVELTNGGEFYKSTGVIEEVSFEPSYGDYFWPSHGRYYVLIPTGEVDADEPAVLFSSRIGSGATATATVDTDLDSETFGKVIAVEITNGGTKYRTSGTGWIATINAGLGHLQTLLGTELPPPAKPDSPQDCDNYWDRWQSITDRVSADPCPADLLNRSYEMFFQTRPSEWGLAGEGVSKADYCNLGYSHIFYDFGSGPITCTLSAE